MRSTESPSELFSSRRLHRAVRAGPGGRRAAAGGFTNLQVWPKDTSRATIMQFMNAFGDSLGITCDYCHVQRDGKFDFASDDKREKRVARQMILLRDSINVVLPAIVGKPARRGADVGQWPARPAGSRPVQLVPSRPADSAIDR